VIHEVVREINLPLDEVGGPDPWAYATYQRGTASNAYSRVHWSYFEPSGGDADCPRDDCGTPGGISCYPVVPRRTVHDSPTTEKGPPERAFRK
jgi:hypothetical protein